MYLKVAVLNNSGNVGKSMVCNFLLQPRLEGSKIIKVETFNSDGTNDVKISGYEFDDILTQIESAECTILDIGASNIEIFLLKMQEFRGSHEIIDLFIIPVTPTEKQQADSAATIEMLLAMGIKKENIRFIFNRASKIRSIEKQFDDFIPRMKDIGFSLTNIPTIYETDFFSMLKLQNKTFLEITNDDRDFKTLLRQSDSREERLLLSEERSIKYLANGINDNFDIAFGQLQVEI